MTVTVTGAFGSAEKLKNTEEELQAYGIPHENYYVDRDTYEIKVITPASTQREIIDILKSHDPVELTTH